MMRTLFSAAFLLLLAFEVPAQDIPDSLQTPSLDTLITEAPQRPSPGGPAVEFQRDTLLLHDYHTVGDAIALQPGMTLYGLGGHGQPSWLGYFGSLPVNQSITRDQIPVTDYFTGVPNLTMVPFEDAETITIYPQHQAFWYGGNGSLLAAEVTSRDFDAPFPLTRIRHMFGPYEYLYTDVTFTMNPGENDNFAAGLTRQTYGTNDAGQFRNSHVERWDLRLRYRYDISDRLQITVGDRYNDHYVRMNGGVAGRLSSDSAYYIYSTPSASNDSALFDPIRALLINPTVLVKELRNAAFASGTLKWFGSESMVTTARVSFENNSHQYEDKGYIYTGFLNGSTAANNSPVIGRSWTNIRLDATHKASIGWAELELGGAFTSLSADHDSAWLGRSSGVTSMVRGLLRFDVQPVRLTGFARLENTYGQNTFGFGGTLETQPLDNLVLWGGLSISTRPYSLFELYYMGKRALGDVRPDPDFEQNILTEGGLRFRTPWFETDARVFVRRSNRSLAIAGQLYPDDSLHSRFAPIWQVADIPSTTSGISLYAKTGIWLLNLELRGSVMTQQFDNADFARSTAPDLQGSADFYLRANTLLVSTLDLKVGARASYTSSYYPTVYLPEQGWFGLPPSVPSAQNDIAAYTEHLRIDAYLYATIRKLATLHVMVYNVLDEKYITTQFYPMPDMGIQFGVDWLLFE